MQHILQQTTDHDMNSAAPLPSGKKVLIYYYMFGETLGDSDYLPLYDVYNIGNHCSEKLLDVIKVLASARGVKLRMEMLPTQPGDVYATYASIDELRKAVGYEPTTSIKQGGQSSSGGTASITDCEFGGGATKWNG